MELLKAHSVKAALSLEAMRAVIVIISLEKCVNAKVGHFE